MFGVYFFNSPIIGPIGLVWRKSSYEIHSRQEQGDSCEGKHSLDRPSKSDQRGKSDPLQSDSPATSIGFDCK